MPGQNDVQLVQQPDKGACREQPGHQPRTQRNGGIQWCGQSSTLAQPVAQRAKQQHQSPGMQPSKRHDDLVEQPRVPGAAQHHNRKYQHKGRHARHQYRALRGMKGRQHQHGQQIEQPLVYKHAQCGLCRDPCGQQVPDAYQFAHLARRGREGKATHVGQKTVAQGRVVSHAVQQPLPTRKTHDEAAQRKARHHYQCWSELRQPGKYLFLCIQPDQGAQIQ